MSKTHSNAFLWYSVLFYISTMNAISFKIVPDLVSIVISLFINDFMMVNDVYQFNDVKCTTQEKN